MSNIEKRSNNSYRVTVSAGFDASGKRIQKKKTISLDSRLTDKQKEKEIHRQAALFEDLVLNGSYTDGNIKLADFANVWLEKYANKNLQANTVVSYEKEIKNRIIPAFGHKRIDKIKPLDLISFYENLQEEGMRLDKKQGFLSDRTIKLQHQILSSMFSTAISWQLLNINPCASVSPPKRDISTTKVIKYLDEKQASIFIGIMEKEELKYRAATYIALWGGLRRGEIHALTWDDIDFDNRRITISKSRTYVPGQGSRNKIPKNNYSNRKIILPEGVMNVLSQLKAQQVIKQKDLGNLWQDSNFVLTAWNGAPMDLSSPYNAMDKAIKRYNASIEADESINQIEKESLLLPSITFHSLRHTSATLLIHAGVNVRAVSNRLGHSMTSTTMNIYAHALQSADQQASDLLDTIIKVPNTTLKIAK